MWLGKTRFQPREKFRPALRCFDATLIVIPETRMLMFLPPFTGEVSAGALATVDEGGGRY